MAHASQALRHEEDHGQLALYRRPARVARPSTPFDWRSGRPEHSRGAQSPLCAGCRAREARYGFRDEGEPQAQRPRTLCFDCFRMEINRRQSVAERLARGWNAHQVNLPLEETLNELTRRRRRAQIAARHALESA